LGFEHLFIYEVLSGAWSTSAVALAALFHSISKREQLFFVVFGHSINKPL
jgi:hypothetical protein